MRKITTALLSVSLASFSLAGCGQAVQSPTALRASAMQAAARTDARATQFARLLTEQGYEQVRVKGGRVELTTSDFKTVYDFSRVDETGKVSVTAKDFTFEVDYAKLVESTEIGPPTADILPAVLIPIAIQVAVGGAIKLAYYAATHRGDKFDKKEAIKATVEGMLAAAVPLVRDVKYAQFLVPLALTILSKSKSLNYKDILETAKGMVGDIAEVIMQMLRSARARA